LEFRLLGPLEVLDDDGAPVPLGGRRPRALLAQLLLQPNGVVSTDRLIDGIWGESPPASAQNALQVHVHALRSALGADRINTRPPGYLVRVDEAELDAERFERLVAAGELHDALALWRGPALADLAGEPFARAGAGPLEERRLAALEARIDADLAAGRDASLVAELDALVASHPHREHLQAQRIVALYRAGRQADALAAYRDARSALDELGLEPSSELRALERRVLEHDPTLAPSAVTEPEHGPGPALVGRELAQAAVSALLERPETRLVTLTGSGGTGKTSLALAVAAGAPFVDLAPVADPALVLPSIGTALGIEETPSDSPAKTIAAGLAARAPTVVLVDNLEHLPQAFTDVSELLREAPTLKILATSRVPLHLAAEREYRVPPLDVPDLGETKLDAIAASSAVRLYVERAAQVAPDFELTNENALAIARITRALDGLPLAIELAAARVRVLGVEGTIDRLGEALSLLRRSAPDLLERQRSLQATIEWSVRLLDRPAQGVLKTLAAFPGGATLTALETVAAPGTDVAEALDVLLDASLVTSTFAAGEPRFGMLDTIKAYATAALDRDEPGHETRLRQLEWCIALADDGEPRYWTRGTPWLDRVEPELANVRAALDFARETDDIEGEARLASSMRHFWRVRGHGIEGKRRLEEALVRAPGVEPRLLARLQHETAVMRLVTGDFEGARTLWLSALEAYTELADTIEVGRVHAELGALENAVGDPRAAIRYSETAVELLEGEEFIQLICLGNLAESYEQSGDLGRARETAHRVLEAQRRSGDRDGVAYMSLTLASVALAQADIAESHRRLVECFTVAAEVGFVEVTGYALGVAADLAVVTEAREDGALLIGACRENFERLGVTPHTPEASRQARVVATLQERLDDADAAIERGMSLGVDAAVALAMTLDAAEG